MWSGIRSGGILPVRQIHGENTMTDLYEQMTLDARGDDPFDPPVAHVWTNGGIPRVFAANAGETLEERVEAVSMEMNAAYPDAVITNDQGLEFEYPVRQAVLTKEEDYDGEG